MSTVSRLKEYLEFRQIPTSRAETACGFGNGTLRNAFEKEKLTPASLGSERLETILNTYKELSAEWLLRGNGSMLVGEGKAIELEQRIETMSKGGRDRDAAYDIVIGMMDVINKTYDFYKEK